MFVLLTILSLAICNVAATCANKDFETVLGGGRDNFSVHEITFDVEPISLDMVVGAKVTTSLD